MKTSTWILLSLLSITQALPANALISRPKTIFDTLEQPIVKTFNAIRSVSLNIKLNNDLSGFIVSKNCSFCKPITIVITPETKAYANNINVPLIQARSRTGRVATIIYNQETNKVNAIHW